MKLSIPESVIFETVDGQAVLLSLDGGVYYKLNGTGARIWALIEQHGDSARVHEAIAREFEGDQSRIERDTGALIKDLETHGLLRVEASTSTD